MKVIVQYETFVSDRDWQWLPGKWNKEIEWTTISNAQTPLLDKVKKPFLARYLACLRTVLAAKRQKADVIVVHGTIIATWVALLAKALRVKTPVLAFAYTIPLWNESSKGRQAFFRLGAKYIDRFLMFSSIETRTYPKVLSVDPARFDMIHWAMTRPDVDTSAKPSVKGRYICAVGGEGRDYSTLIEAMRGLPDIRLAIVARPQNVAGIDIPENVELFTDIPYSHAMNIMVNSEFTVLPLLSSTVPCGHGTLIAGFLLKLPTIVTASKAMEDYGEAEKTVLTHVERDPKSLEQQIARLWGDEALKEQLALNGLKFAEDYCSERATIDYFENYLDTLEQRTSA
ncbi:MAG: hypothetical protein ACWA5X_04930 [bacterium]